MRGPSLGVGRAREVVGAAHESHAGPLQNARQPFGRGVALVHTRALLAPHRHLDRGRHGEDDTTRPRKCSRRKKEMQRAPEHRCGTARLTRPDPLTAEIKAVMPRAATCQRQFTASRCYTHRAQGPRAGHPQPAAAVVEDLLGPRREARPRVQRMRRRNQYRHLRRSNEGTSVKRKRGQQLCAEASRRRPQKSECSSKWKP